MEILNNIWTALSTPNEGLLNIITIPLFFVETFLIMQLFLSVIELDHTKKQTIVYTISISVVSIFTKFFISNPFNIFMNYLAIFLLAYFIIKNSFLKTFTSIVISLLILNLIGGLLLNPYITIFKITTNELNTIPLYNICYMSIIYMVMFAVSSILKHKDLNMHFLDTIDNKTKFTLFITLILGIITILVQATTLFYYVDTLPLMITFLNFITFLAFFCISIYSITRVFKLTLVTRKLQSAEEYNNTLRILHDNVRGFKHDFDNIVTTIGGYIRTNDMEGLKKYYVQLEDDCQRVNNLYILNPDIVNNDGVYNLLTKKYHEAEEKDIKVNITFLLDLSTLKMKIYEFARILGILLDNAIEASSACEEKVINLIFRDDSKNSRQLIIVENTYSDKNVNTEKIFEKRSEERR